MGWHGQHGLFKARSQLARLLEGPAAYGIQPSDPSTNPHMATGHVCFPRFPVIAGISGQPPALIMYLPFDIGLAGLPPGVQGVEFQLEIVLGWSVDIAFWQNFDLSLLLIGRIPDFSNRIKDVSRAKPRQLHPGLTLHSLTDVQSENRARCSAIWPSSSLQTRLIAMPKR